MSTIDDSAVELHSKPLHLILVDAGVGSRKHSLSLVYSGRVCLNGQIVKDRFITANLSGGDVVTLDGQAIIPEQLRYLLVHKPRGVLCSMNDENDWNKELVGQRPLLSSLIPSHISERLGHAGRLDLDSEGLVLLTNDRHIMNLVIEPSGFCRKQYVVTVMGSPSETDLDFLRGGPKIGGMGQLLPCQINVLENIAPTKGEWGIRRLTRLEVELKEGKNQQIRRMFSSIGNRVVRLVRVSIGPLKLESVPMLGEARELTDEEVKHLGMCCVNSAE
eukprot:scaffold48991_cov47-Attheya_sp.AAC.1